jgi:hypothetical protein
VSDSAIEDTPIGIPIAQIEGVTRGVGVIVLIKLGERRRRLPETSLEIPDLRAELEA